MMDSQSPSRSGADESLSVTVVREIAAHDGVDPMELSPPLFHAIDSAALDALFEPTESSGSRTGRVTFTYDGKRVTVDSDGAVEIDPDAPSESTTDSERRRSPCR